MSPLDTLPERLRARVRAAGFASPLYALTLKGKVPERLARRAEDVWPGDAARGNALFHGRYAFAGAEVVARGDAPWRARPPSRTWLAELHGFGWLRDLQACGGGAAARVARELVRRWIEDAGAWDAERWAPEVLARRLAAWSCHGGYLLDGADSAFAGALLESFAAQARHLARVAPSAPPGAPRLTAAIGCLVALRALGEDGRRAARAEAQVEAALAEQVRADGSHLSRDPAAMLALLGDLLVLESVLEPDETLRARVHEHALRLGHFLRFLRHGDGGLPLFHGGREGERALIDVALARLGKGGRRLEAAPESGFERLAANRTRVVVDAAAPPAVSANPAWHASTLAFEMSVGRQRLIVNCGAAPNEADALAPLLRRTAAHSTLIVGDADSSPLDPAPRGPRRPLEVRAERREADGATWLDLRHGGYAASFGLVHERRLYLDAAGADLRGEDRLVPAASGGGALPAFALRFHLHPEVRASLVQQGGAVLLRLGAGEGWQFRAAGAALALEPSVYLGAGPGRRTEQIVLAGGVAPGGVALKWRLNRIGGE